MSTGQIISEAIVKELDLQIGVARRGERDGRFTDGYIVGLKRVIKEVECLLEENEDGN